MSAFCLTASRPSRRQFLSATAALGASAYVPADMAQAGKADKWPHKTRRIVVAFPPGGLTDAYARMYAEQLTAKLGVAAVVDNKPGGGAIIAIDAVAKAPADGYTLLMTTSGTVWQNRVLYNKVALQPGQRPHAGCQLPLRPAGGGGVCKSARAQHA